MSSQLHDELQEILGSAYRIDRELGGAGMSRVFVATDTELDRQVVVKVLPPELSAGVNTERFRREIQLAAKLQHPHIVPLLATGTKGSLLYYTMPFIVGDNLRARLMRSGDLPVHEATKILREVADALSYAHSNGVVHRDIKPENILISGNHALVTDFGVSKALSSSTAEMPNGPATLTSLGMALGTPAYMAPEQAAADPMVDARADIYALGIVGYELLTGRTPFAGLNQQQTLAAHITTTAAPIIQQRPQLPAGLAAAIMRCLEKRPSDRFQSADELQTALEPYAVTSGAMAPSEASARRPFKWTPQRIAVAAGITGIIAAGVIGSTIAFRQQASPLIAGQTRQITNAPGLEITPKISPDGKLIAYGIPNGDSYTLYVKQLSGGRPIVLSDSGVFATWTPDGSKILFTSAGYHNFTVPALGGVPTPVPALDGLAVCSYSNAGDRLACVDVQKSTLTIAGANGENRRPLPATASSDGLMMPSWSPDDKLIAYTVGNQQFFIGENIGNLAPSSVWVVRAEGGSPVRISDNSHLNVSPVWTPDGGVMFVSSLRGNRDIYLQRIDGSLAPHGSPMRITTGLNAHTISIDRAGRTVAYSIFTTIANEWAAPIVGDAEHPRLAAITTGNQTVESADVSPDGQWLAYDSNINGNQDIFKVRVSGGEPQQLTHNGVDNFRPVWSPDGSHIAFHSPVHGTRDIYQMDASGGNVTTMVATPSEELAPAWTPDGRKIVYQVLPDSAFEIGQDPAHPSGWGKPRYRARIGTGAFSPDGKNLLIGVGEGRLCGDCVGGIYIMSPDWTNKRLIPFASIAKAQGNPGSIVWSRDSRHAYLSMREKDGSSSIWQIPINGDAERRVLHLIDPARGFFRTPIAIDANRFYFSIGDRQSDIWTVELRNP